MTNTTPRIEVRRLHELAPDRRNANKGTARGGAMIEHSVQHLGLGRSVLLDRHGNIIAGNKTVEKTGETGAAEEVIVVHTTGNQLVAVMRDDLDLYDESDTRARELAHADNRSQEIDLAWDAQAISQDIAAGLDLSPYWRDPEIERLLKIDIQFAGEGMDLPTGLTETSAAPALPDSHVRMVQLFYNGTTHPEFLRLVEALAPHFSTANPTDTVLEVLRHAYRQLVDDAE